MQLAVANFCLPLKLAAANFQNKEMIPLTVTEILQIHSSLAAIALILAGWVKRYLKEHK